MSSQGMSIESRDGRRIAGRLASGEDLLEGLLAICQAQQVRTASVQAGGVLEEVALAHYDRSTRAMGKPRWFRTTLQILTVQGTLSERDGKPFLLLNIVVSRQGDNGIEVLGGVATSARVLACEYIIDAMDDVLLRRGIDRETGLPLWQALYGRSNGAGRAHNGPDDAEHEPPEQPAHDPPEQPGNWELAIAASQRTQAGQERRPELQDEYEALPYHPIRVGDILDHAKFGRCVVERIDANEEFATVRLRNNRLVRLNIEVLNLRYEGDEDGHHVFTTAAKV